MQENSNKNIVLIGMMGAGKSYIGGKLAKLLVHFDYVDIDSEIEKRQGTSISEIFETHSEEYFRALEEKMIKEFSALENQIMSLGGGAFENPKNRERLKENGLTFYLKAPAEELFIRIKNETHRPLLKDGFSVEKIKGLLNKREKNYLKADFIIDTNKHRAYTILNDIIKEYENYVAK